MPLVLFGKARWIGPAFVRMSLISRLQLCRVLLASFKSNLCSGSQVGGPAYPSRKSTSIIVVLTTLICLTIKVFVLVALEATFIRSSSL